MGIRHCIGALQVREIFKICICDINDPSLYNAKQQLSSDANYNKLIFCKTDEVKGHFDFVIIASTADSRIATCRLVLNFSPSQILIEKPLGQSLEEVKNIIDFLSNENVNVSVNLNMRMYPFIKRLKSDLTTLPQFKIINSINYQGGTLGIGANGIHYLDILFFLFGASRAEVAAGEIDSELIPSGRGEQFADFGGWACFKFYDDSNNFIGRSLFSLSATSTVFGGWEIIGTHGRIRINELEGERINILRKAESTLPINRYAGDYLRADIGKIESPFLGDLTKEWISGIIEKGENNLPLLHDTLKVHELLFQWLALSKTYKEKFPIT